MCGICGSFDYKHMNRVKKETLVKMTSVLIHRGPDECGYYIDHDIALGFCRLGIIDLANGSQPLVNEDNTLKLICNGEIYNYKELSDMLRAKGHKFSTTCDVEVILHLYEEVGGELVHYLNGQFAFALFDDRQKRLICARDYVGIAPFYYTIVDGLFIFGSEIKSILRHEMVEKQLDLTGLDQIMYFPGLVSPQTMFRNIYSLKAGHILTIDYGLGVEEQEYWDLNYPKEGEAEYRQDDNYYIEHLDELLSESVRLRLNADVPVGFYISGGLDSALIGAMIKKNEGNSSYNSYSVNFPDKAFSEGKFQRIVAKELGSIHHEVDFDAYGIASRLKKVIYHSECALKESYNTASLALSEAAHADGIKVILTGEGADELYGGYIGYRFDKMKQLNRNYVAASNDVNEKLLRSELWGVSDFLYEKPYYSHMQGLKELYSKEVNAVYKEICCLNQPLINKERLKGRSIFSMRSYLDFKLRMCDHLLTDHGDRMALANSVEARYPFLDKNVIEFSLKIPEHLKVRQYTEKYILKKIADKIVPKEIVNRSKFAFVAPGSQTLLKQDIEYINDILSYETIKRQGIFNPDTVEKLKVKYLKEGFRLNIPYDDDILITVITFGIFLENLKMYG